jgi:hypothetical protein
MPELDMKNLPPPKLLVPHLGPTDAARRSSSTIRNEGQSPCMPRIVTMAAMCRIPGGQIV